MQIIIKNQITQKTITLHNVEHSDTIDDLKKRIQQSTGTSLQQQGLTKAGKYHLEGDRELWEYNIQDGSTLELYFVLSVPIPVLSNLSGTKHDNVGNDIVLDEEEYDEFEIPDFDLTPDELEVSKRGKRLRKEPSLWLGDILEDLDSDRMVDDYDPVMHQSTVEDMLNSELVSLISLDDSEYSDDDDDDINNEIRGLDAVNDASWGLVPEWY